MKFNFIEVNYLDSISGNRKRIKIVIILFRIIVNFAEIILLNEFYEICINLRCYFFLLGYLNDFGI